MSSSTVPECQICLREFNHTSQKPMVGLCGHSFCLFCCDRFAAARCPVCRKDASFDKTTPNFSVLELIEKKEGEEEEASKNSIPARQNGLYALRIRLLKEALQGHDQIIDGLRQELQNHQQFGQPIRETSTAPQPPTFVAPMAAHPTHSFIVPSMYQPVHSYQPSYVMQQPPFGQQYWM